MCMLCEIILNSHMWTPETDGSVDLLATDDNSSCQFWCLSLADELADTAGSWLTPCRAVCNVDP